jgi:hypothetical protein
MNSPIYDSIFDEIASILSIKLPSNDWVTLDYLHWCFLRTVVTPTPHSAACCVPCFILAKKVCSEEGFLLPISIQQGKPLDQYWDLKEGQGYVYFQGEWHK